MAIYLYNLPKEIRPFVNQDFISATPIKDQPDMVRVIAIRNTKTITLKEKEEMEAKGFRVWNFAIRFVRNAKSVKDTI